MRNLTAPKQYIDGQDRTTFDAGTEGLVLYTPSGEPVRLHIGADGFLYLNGQAFGVQGMPPALHASMHATNGGDPVTPASIGAVSEQRLTATATANGVPVLDANGHLPVAMISGTISPAHHAASHAKGGADAILPADIGAVAVGDARLSDARPPLTHAANHATGGNDSINPESIGAVSGADARLTDARTPKPHSATHHKNGIDPISWDDVGSVDAGKFTARERIPNGYPQLNDSGHIDINLLPANALLPGPHASSHAAGGSDTITAISIDAADRKHAHGDDDITSLDASKVTSGVLDIARIPQGALERLKIVTDLAAMLALTSADVQTGDTVQRNDTGVMYRVIDETALGTISAFVEYSAGRAAAVDWPGIEHKPSVLVAAPITGGGSLTGNVSIGVALCSTSAPGVVQPSESHFTVAAGVLTPKAASTAQPGIVQLNSAIDSTSNTDAATPSAVKIAYDAAIQAASTTQAGRVQLNDTITSTSTEQAATANAAKQLKDLIDSLTARVAALESGAVLSGNIASIVGTELPEGGVGQIEYTPR